MPRPDHTKFPSIQRLSSETVVITEKIDGTNAVLFVDDDKTCHAGSRERWITPETDNFGWATWVRDNASELWKLGPGFHYGEWWGSGIQRRYGIPEKRFSSFEWWRTDLIPLVGKVPLLYEGPYIEGLFEREISKLVAHGSVAAPGFMDPEGIVIQFRSQCAREAKFKKFCKNDLVPKSKQAQH